MDTPALIATLTTSLAIGLTIVLLRILRQERQRSDARVAALVAMSAHRSTSAMPMPAASMTSEHAPVRLEPKTRRDTGAPALFDAAAPRATRSLFYIGAGALSLAALIALSFGWVFSAGPVPAAETTASISTGAPAQAAPLALMALRHEQSADGTLVISGVVRNPAESAARQKLFAAASLVDAGGALVATARAPLDFTILEPGDESPFVVRVTGATGVARYRIGFRDAQGTSVAHLDKR